MPTFESSDFCSLQEFEAGKDSRLTGDMLVVDEVCLLMMSLRGSQHRLGAKKPAQVLNVQATGNGLYNIKFNTLNDHFQPDTEVDGVFSDGFWDNTTGIVIK